jgi:hypothetical protein
MEIEEFELGKCYRHNGGGEMHIVGVIDSIMWGIGYVAEEGDGQTLTPVAMNCKDSAANWFEITKEEYMKNYS